MDAEKVEMMCLSSALADLPADLRAMALDPEWWAELELTPEGELDRDQRRMIAALAAG